MIQIVFGTIAFGLFILSDWLGYKTKSSKYMFLFYLGGILLVGATFVCIPIREFVLNFKNILLGIMALLSLFMLIYSVFFALDKGDDKGDENELLPLTDTGVYAACRHPGVIFLCLFYLCLYGVFTHKSLFICLCFFSIYDIFYVIWQDVFLFEKTIEGYASYKERTPFLLPTVGGVKNCVAYLYKKHQRKG
ncbi:MAG: hypothetical protein RR198_03360 [Oscillospiraceae bacterium]